VLAYRVSMARISSEKWLGDKSSADPTTSASSDPLYVASRCHQNFAENVPLALLMGAIVEMNGGNRRALTAGFAGLIIARILHVEFGLRSKDSKGTEGLGTGRIVGHFSTLGFMVGMAGYAAYLVKGYWGL
jgi:uncharacterized protein